MGPRQCCSLLSEEPARCCCCARLDSMLWWLGWAWQGDMQLRRQQSMGARTHLMADPFAESFFGGSGTYSRRADQRMRTDARGDCEPIRRSMLHTACDSVGTAGAHACDAASPGWCPGMPRASQYSRLSGYSQSSSTEVQRNVPAVQGFRGWGSQASACSAACTTTFLRRKHSSARPHGGDDARSYAMQPNNVMASVRRRRLRAPA